MPNFAHLKKTVFFIRKHVSELGVVPITLKYKPRKPKLVQQGDQDQDQHYQQVS